LVASFNLSSSVNLEFDPEAMMKEFVAAATEEQIYVSKNID